MPEAPRPDILLTTFNARFSHTSLALRALMANLGSLRQRARIVEFVIQDRAADIAETLLDARPSIVGIGVYVWNAELAAEVVEILKSVRPDLVVVLGGPEVSHEVESQRIVERADYTVAGEGELAFANLCRRLVEGGERPPGKVIRAPLADLSALASPYPLYTDRDLRERTVYVEASRGCPFECEFCLSALDEQVRHFPIDGFLADLQLLIDRGARAFKFIDRTFNLKPSVAARILELLLERVHLGLFAHFEMVPDRLPEPLRALLARFPAGSLQLEIGVQTFDSATAERISRRLDVARTTDNFDFLIRHTSAHLHADLVAGLPGETLASFAAGFDRLWRLGPHEIQVGILKRLRGAPIARYDHECSYSSRPPYEVLSTSVLSFAELQRLKRFARAWDLVANRGNFPETLPLLLGDGSPFDGFMRFSDWLHARVGRFAGIALLRLCRLIFDFLSTELELDGARVTASLARDYGRVPGRRLPDFLADRTGTTDRAEQGAARTGTPGRQARHLLAQRVAVSEPGER